MAEIYGAGTLPTHYAINQSTQILDRPALVLRGKFKCRHVRCVFAGIAGPMERLEVDLFQTILPPGSPSASVGGDFLSDGIYSVPEAITRVV